MTIKIRPADEEDMDEMWRIFSAVTATGDTLPFWTEYDQSKFYSEWAQKPGVFVAEQNEEVIGMYQN